MSEHDHHHEHDEHCKCGCHDHEHHHHEHDEHCDCGCHDHEHHHHEHDEHCDCGCHDHEHHHHEHDEHCDCGCHDHEHHHHEHDEHCDCGCHDHDHTHTEQKQPGVVYTKVRPHDDATVVSGELTLVGDYAQVREKLNESLTAFAAAVTEKVGVIGHIKASVTVSSVEMFSVTDVDVMIKTAPQQEIQIILAAIVFFITEEDAQHMAQEALEAVL